MEILDRDPDIEVVGAAPDAYVAREKIKELNPDVLTLDVEMPRMDGVTFLRNLMRLRPMPVVMVSTLTEAGAEVTLDALSVGAVDFLAKPKLDVAAKLNEYREVLIEKIKTAAVTRVKRYDPAVEQSVARTADGSIPAKAPVSALNFRTTDQLIAVGASTGGTEAIHEFLVRLPPDAPPIVITQHIPKAFSGPFAQRMDRTTSLRVCEAEDGQQILPGHVYIAPGDLHLAIERSGARWKCKLLDTEPVNRHKPSVDVLFDSVVKHAGRNAIGVILTGMGKDGAQGLKAMKEVGSPTIAQDEATSVVWGMPGESVKIGAALEVLPLQKISARVMQLVGGVR